MRTTPRTLRSMAALALAAGLLGTGIAPAFAATPATPKPAPAVAAAHSAHYPSEWSSPNGDWVISTKHAGNDTTIDMGTWSHRGTIRVFVTDPTGKRTSHDFRLQESHSMAGWYQFSGSWRAHYPDAGPGQYKVVFTMKASHGWENICDTTLGFVVR